MTDPEPTGDGTREPPSRAPAARLLQGLLVALAVLLQLAALWLVLVSGLVAPPWAVGVLGLVWVGSCVPLVRGVRARRRWVPLVPVGVALFWFAFVNLGEVALGWTA